MTLLLCLPGLVSGSQQTDTDKKLSVSISKTDKQWGQYLRATIRYKGTKLLENIELQAWHELAAITIEDEFIDEDKNARPVQVLKLRLYPRKPGEFQLPPLVFGNARSKPVSLNISSPVVKNASIKLDWSLSDHSPWQREAVLVKVHLETPDQAARIVIDNITNRHFISRRLQTSRTQIDGIYHFTAGWIFYPLTSGLQLLELPPVRYQISGSDRRRFYLPLKALKIQTLPNYLPPTLPVGDLNVDSRLTISADEDNKTIWPWTPDKKWQIDIATDALIPYGIPELDTQIVALNGHNITDIAIHYSQYSQPEKHGDKSTYLAPLPDWLLPSGEELSLTLRYFNTETGRLEKIKHQLPRQWTMPVWAWWITVFLCIICLILSVFYKLLPALSEFNHKRRLHYQLDNSVNTQQLREVILQSDHCTTLSDWAADDPVRLAIIADLNAYTFSANNNVNLDKLKSRLLQHSDVYFKQKDKV